MATERGIVTIGYLKEYPKLSTSAIARMLFNDYPHIFDNIEKTRDIVRYYRNEKSNYKKHTQQEYMRTKEERNMAQKTTFIPQSDYKKSEVFVVPRLNNKGIIWNDVHIPYHDMQAIETAMTYAHDFNPNFIYLNGDIMDMYQASRYVKDRFKRDLAGEIEMTYEFLKLLRDTYDCPIYYKMGNHEDRWEHYLMTKAPELLGIKEFKLCHLLKFGELGVQEVASKQMCKIGDMTIMHGHEFGQSVFSPVNSARGLYMKAKVNCAVGHHHQTSEHSEKDLAGNVVTTWSIGALCGLSPDYFPYNKWNHGFATIETEPNGEYEFRNLRIIDGKVR